MSAALDASIEQLHALLKRQKDQLLDGDFRSFRAELEHKRALVEHLEAAAGAADGAGLSAMQHGRLRQVVSLATENAAHMQAVRRGLVAAAHRLQAASGETHIGSYGPDGRDKLFAYANGGFEKKI